MMVQSLQKTGANTVVFLQTENMTVPVNIPVLIPNMAEPSILP